MTSQNYRYKRTDFRPRPVSLDHLDIHLNFLDDRVEGVNELTLTVREPLNTLTLDARDLTVHGVETGGTPLVFDVDASRAKLHVELGQTVEPGTRLTITTRTACVPSDHILEGIYKDTTPDGCPQQMMSQCQQWGFQRILPVLDDCTAKCTMRTTLEADARYTHLISNGDADRTTNPDGIPVPKPGDAGRQVMTYTNPVPMAPYLFIAAVGTWDVLEDRIVYPSGKVVRLEYLVPPGRVDGARVPMKILKDAVLWQGKTQNYEYPYEVYRTICMEKSNFGGMENVGNTTIVTSAALVDAFTSDTRLEYAYGVIVHEFEHNQCGSEVTMETPFDMWLNEAFTVDVERQFTAERFDPDGCRLDEVDAIRAPMGGPLAVEDGGHLGNIVREGFNHPDELVDGVTYVKAAEVIRMLRLIIGTDAFTRAKDLYFSRYHGGNANTDQFFACFEEISGRDLTRFKREWLYTIGYPHVEAWWQYNTENRTLEIRLQQARSGKGGLFHVPVVLAAVDRDGHDMPGTARVVELEEANETVTLHEVDPPAFVSINRDCSFYGTFSDRSATPELLALQAQLDPNRFNRVEAMRRLTDSERLKLVRDPTAAIDETWLTLWHGVLKDTRLPPGLKAHLLRIEEQSLDRKTLPLYRERYRARIAMLGELSRRFSTDLEEAFNAVDTYRQGSDPRDGLEERKLKAVLLRTLVESDTDRAHEVAETHFHKAWNFSDKASALRCLMQTNHPRRDTLLHEALDAWGDHLNGYTMFLSISASGRDESVFERIAREESRARFKMEHPSHTRALYLPVAGNNALLWTEQGIAWLTETVVKLAQVSEHTALYLVDSFRLVDRLADDLRPRVQEALRIMRTRIDAEKAPSVTGRITTYLQA